MTCGVFFFIGKMGERGQASERDARGGGLACVSVVGVFPARPPLSAEGCVWLESSRSPLVLYSPLLETEGLQGKTCSALDPTYPPHPHHFSQVAPPLAVAPQAAPFTPQLHRSPITLTHSSLPFGVPFFLLSLFFT